MERMIDCPKCESDFDSEKAMKIHHKLKHGESLATEMGECISCGSSFEYYPSEKDGIICPTCFGERGTVMKFEKIKDKSLKKLKDEGHYEKLSEKLEGENNPMAGGHSQESIEKIREASIGRTHTEETKRKISEANEGNSLTEETKSQISETLKGKTEGEKNAMYGVTGEDHPAYGNSRRGSEKYYSEEYGHIIRSSWEEKIANLLSTNDIDYEYEDVTFYYDEFTYTPDFFVGEYVIEVKGFADARSKGQASMFMEVNSDEYEYIVLSEEKMPCDIHIKWKNKERLLEVIDE